ncbi:MAG TPA: hypothetical protein VFJ00_01415 [Candidatus Limnocylindria bacterium]|nr:hypothetical protein [Candidatus Limnocylindria bacterium]
MAIKGGAGAFGLAPGQCLAVKRGLGQLSAAQRLEDLARDPMLAQLGLDHTTTAGRVAVALLGPPSRECGVVHVSHHCQAVEGGGDHPVVG